MKTGEPLVAGIVGIDGCGKSSTFRSSLDRLAKHMRVAGVGDQVLSGGPDEPLRERNDIPLSRSARTVGRFAKGLRWQGLYKQLKFLELTERTHIRDYVTTHAAPAAILTDGDPLVNTAAWAVARFYRKELSGDDEELLDVLHFMAGHQRVPLREVPYYLRRAWQLVLLNRLHLARFEFPDLIFLLEIDPAVAMSRIRARGRPLQVHETEDFLTELARAYARICRVLEERCDVPVVKIQVDQTTPEETTRTVVDAVLDQVQRQGEPEVVEGYAPDSIEIVATTMSGSIQDQRKVGQIGPEFRSRTAQPVRVHLARNHAEAQAAARAIVTGGGRTIVSAGGAGTFNAVLEGCHVNGIVPADLHLAFLRKGSADLIGKALNVPDELQAAAAAIVDGIESDHLVAADILAIEAADPKGRKGVRHMVGFGGLGIFGDVPRFTETRVVKFYKGILGTLFGDLGPFYVGLALATIYWRIQRLLSRVSPISLTLDGEELPPDIWGTVTVINGDLGKDFPLGRGLALSSGSFRVVALRYRGMRKALKQINACRTARVLDDPDHYAAIVRDVRDLRARPVKPTPPYMVNVDGLRMMVRGAVRIRVSGQVQLVAGQRAPRQGSSQETKELQPA